MYRFQNFSLEETGYHFQKNMVFLPLLSGTFRVTFVALAISVPVSIMSAVYMSEYAGKKTRDVFKLLIETMSALPSVVLGIYWTLCSFKSSKGNF